MSNKQMSIFNLLDGIVEPDKDHIKSMIRSKTFHEIRPNLVKTMGGTKQKGLSIRSNSAMNISQSKHPDTIKKNTYGNKEQNFLKSKITQVDINGCPISPGIEAKKLSSSKFKKPLPKEETTKKTTKTTLNDGILKESISFKKNIKEFPEPEKLAPWFDDQREFDYGYIDAVDKEFKDMFSKKKENFEQEKTLISETSDLVEIPDLISDRSINENCTNCLFPDLPEISDISDDDYL